MCHADRCSVGFGQAGNPVSHRQIHICSIFQTGNLKGFGVSRSVSFGSPLLLKQGLDLLTGQRQLHQRVAEWLDLRQVAKRYIAFRKIGADAARIHEGKICDVFAAIFKISLSHSVGNQVAERSFIIVCIRTGNRTVCGADW
ncbi:hypothetical protein D3C73_1011380 [compost metagenome]